MSHNEKKVKLLLYIKLTMCFPSFIFFVLSTILVCTYYSHLTDKLGHEIRICCIWPPSKFMAKEVFALKFAML